MSQLSDEALVYVTASTIHGKGLFARKRIRAGTLIGQIDGRPTSIDGPYVLWLTQSEGGRGPVPAQVHQPQRRAECHLLRHARSGCLARHQAR